MNAEQKRQFEKNIQINVENILKEQEIGVNIRKRIRWTGNQKRIDQITIKPEDWNQSIFASELIESDVNGAYDGTSIVNGQTGITCYHATKTMEIRRREKELMKRDDLYDIIDSPLSALKELLADRQSDSIKGVVISQEKLDTLSRTGKIDNTEIKICTEPNTIQHRERVELDVNQVPLAIFICDSNDYSLIYYTEVRMPITGKLIYIKECNDFDSQGIARNVAVTKYELDGSLKERKIYKILDVNINAVLSEDLFTFNPPEEYEIIEVEPNGARKVIREKGGIEGAMRVLLKAQKGKNIETLKNLLGHEIWQIRLRSLQVLSSLLEQNREELKETATILKNDENLKVREEAQKILNHIDRLDSSRSPVLPEKK
jgi:hypothetical protein